MGRSRNRPLIAETDPSEWPGENLLGDILMELREEIDGGHAAEDEPKRKMTEICMIKADITKLSDVDAIVNAAKNRQPT